MARVQIGHDDDGQLVINVARNVHGEACQAPHVRASGVCYFRDAPSESIGRSLAAVQLYRRPHLSKLDFSKASRYTGRRPLGEVEKHWYTGPSAVVFKDGATILDFSAAFYEAYPAERFATMSASLMMRVEFICSGWKTWCWRSRRKTHAQMVNENAEN